MKWTNIRNLFLLDPLINPLEMHLHNKRRYGQTSGVRFRRRCRWYIIVASRSTILMSSLRDKCGIFIKNDLARFCFKEMLKNTHFALLQRVKFWRCVHVCDHTGNQLLIPLCKRKHDMVSQGFFDIIFHRRDLILQRRYILDLGHTVKSCAIYIEM